MDQPLADIVAKTAQPTKVMTDISNTEAGKTRATYTSPTSATGASQPGMNCRPAARARESMVAWSMRLLPLHNAQLSSCSALATHADFDRRRLRDAAIVPSSLTNASAVFPRRSYDSAARGTKA
jgi:hypothetical protein